MLILQVEKELKVKDFDTYINIKQFIVEMKKNEPITPTVNSSTGKIIDWKEIPINW